MIHRIDRPIYRIPPTALGKELLSLPEVLEWYMSRDRFDVFHNNRFAYVHIPQNVIADSMAGLHEILQSLPLSVDVVPVAWLVLSYPKECKPICVIQYDGCPIVPEGHLPKVFEVKL